VTRGPSGMQVRATPLPQMPSDLKALFDPKPAVKQEVAR